MLKIIQCLLCALGLLAASLQAQDALELRVFDIEGATRSRVSAEPASWSLAIREAYRRLDGGEEVAAEEEEEYGGADMVVRLVRDSVDPSSWELEGRMMRLNETGTRLFVRQTRANLDQIESLLDLHAASHARGIKIEALVLSGGAAELAGLGGNRHIVSSERFDKIRAGITGMNVLASLQGSARDGQRLILRSGTMKHFLARQASQIAQTAALTEPRSGRLFVGVELYLRPLLAPDGKINLRVQSRLGSGLELETRRSRAPGVGPIQLPSMRESLLSSTAMLSSGEAIVLGAIGAGDPQARLLLIRVTNDAPTDGKFGGSRFPLRSYRCGYLSSSFLSLPRLELGYLAGGLRVYDESDRRDSIFGSGYGYLSPESIMDMVRQVVTPRFWDENRYILDPEATSLWLSAGEEQHDGMAKMLAGLAADRAHFLDVEAFCLRIDRKTLESIRQKSGETWLREVLRSPQAVRLHSMVGSAELGSRIEFAEGVERAWVSEADADVAQGADILTPSVETGFNGLYLRLAPYRLDAKTLGLDFRYELIGPPLSLEALPDASGPSLDLQMATAGWSNGKGHAELSLGEYSLLAEMTPPGSAETSTLLVLRLR